MAEELAQASGTLEVVVLWWMASEDMSIPRPVCGCGIGGCCCCERIGSGIIRLCGCGIGCSCGSSCC